MLVHQIVIISIKGIYGKHNILKIKNSKSAYSQHGFTTQITTIPGGLKRQTEQIKDDKNIFKKSSQSFLYKLSRDFSTKETNEFLSFVKNNFYYLKK